MEKKKENMERQYRKWDSKHKYEKFLKHEHMKWICTTQMLCTMDVGGKTEIKVTQKRSTSQQSAWFK